MTRGHLIFPTHPPRRLVLATDLDGTFLGGTPDERQALYHWLMQHRDAITLIFVTGRDLPFIHDLIADDDVPRPDFIIADVGTTIAGGPDLQPLPELEAPIAAAWRDGGNTVRTLLANAPGLRLQDTPFRHRLSYFYDPDTLDPETLTRIEGAGYDWLLSADTFLDVLPRGISKGPTLMRVLDHLDLPTDRVLTAGDTLNDLTLFTTGLAGVAVGNAEPALRERLAGLPKVYQSRGHGAAGILEAIARHPAL